MTEREWSLYHYVFSRAFSILIEHIAWHGRGWSILVNGEQIVVREIAL